MYIHIYIYIYTHTACPLDRPSLLFQSTPAGSASSDGLGTKAGGGSQT